MKKSVMVTVVLFFLLACIIAQSSKNFVRNGNFEAENALGWNIQFSEWGDGEEKAAWSLTTNDDNLPNKTQKLNLFNGLKNKVTFTMTQTIRVSPGTYACSLIFEGGSAGLNSNTTLSVDGKSVNLGKVNGWQKWKQVVIKDIKITQPKNVEIKLEGSLLSMFWMDIDDIEFVEQSQFNKRKF